MSIGYDEDRYGSNDGDDDDAVTMTKLIISNKILHDVVSDITDRYIALKTVVSMAKVLPDDIISYKFVVKAVEDIVNTALTNGFLKSWLDSEDPPNDE
jgi:hypothetical protein|tara:strand:+ start:337 stop:630 length:294 start_codon:yes stop_codon:yes gene_type:complete